MKLEKINENQIRCTLSKDDLEDRNLKLSELAYGSDNARSLFQEMMQQAFYEFGFESENVPLMIEAIPVNADCIILNITKVDDPDELDERFSHYPKLASRIAESKENDDEDEIEENEPSNTVSFSSDESNPKETILELLSEIGQELQELSSESKKETHSESKSPKIKQPSKNISYQVFTFDNLSEVIYASKTLSTIYDDENTLYKSPIDQQYYLVLFQTYMTPESFSNACSVLCEFTNKAQGTYASHIYLQEHFLPIQNNNAIQQLSLL